MTDKRHPEEERQALAAEYTLGLLTSDEARGARELAATDADFAGEVARWRGRLAPLAGDVESVDPPGNVWSRIASAIDGTADGSNVIQLRRRVNVWRGATAGMTALAAALAGVLVLQPHTVPPPPPVVEQPSGPPMVAMLSNDQKDMKVMASWNPATRQLVLAVAGEMPADASHAHELWVIPAGGKPRSLGTMGGGKQMHMRLADAIAALMENGATVAISVEPPGGSPTGSPTGPVIASGALTRA
jgi:anti-sigma-K factor RskA